MDDEAVDQLARVLASLKDLHIDGTTTLDNATLAQQLSVLRELYAAMAAELARQADQLEELRRELAERN